MTKIYYLFKTSTRHNKINVDLIESFSFFLETKKKKIRIIGIKVCAYYLSPKWLLYLIYYTGLNDRYMSCYLNFHQGLRSVINFVSNSI